MAGLGEVALASERGDGRDGALVAPDVLPEALAQDTPAQLAEQHVVGGGVLGVVLEAGPLEVLDGVLPAVLEGFPPLPGEGEAVACQATVGLPVVEEPPA